jgi:hypothetical protein
MLEYYAKGGFVFSHRNMRFRAEIPESPKSTAEDDERVVPLATFPIGEVLEYDRTCFPAARPTFLTEWISQSSAQALGCARDGRLAGYGVVRRCGDGCKIGPLFADDGTVAEALYACLSEFAAGGPLYLDAPENNPVAMDLVERHQMVEVFGCARMYLGPPPDIAHKRVFGVTTFELG